jgi:hypothetical protein
VIEEAEDRAAMVYDVSGKLAVSSHVVCLVECGRF